MEELYVVIGADFTGRSWICEYDYDSNGCSKQMLTKDQALEFVKEFDDLVASGSFEYKVTKLTFLD